MLKDSPPRPKKKEILGTQVHQRDTIDSPGQGNIFNINM